MRLPCKGVSNDIQGRLRRILVPKAEGKMGDFAKRMAAQIQDAEKQREETNLQANTESKVAFERENLKRKLAPELWHSFRAMIVAKCDEVNGEVRKARGKDHYRCHDELPDKLHVIRLSPVANLRLEFFPDGSRIHYDCGECVGDYLVEIGDAGQAILSDPYHRVFDLESTAEHLLQNCLEKAPF